MTKPVVIVGAGPAGLSCAARLASADVRVLMIDDNPQPGGQYFRQLPPGYRTLPQSGLLRETERAQALFRAVDDPHVTRLSGTTAWAAPSPKTIAYAGPSGAGRVEARAVVIATGAQDAPFPFPGWTLPGVISAGGCLNLAKGHGLVPAGKIVVAGNGPLVLVAAATLAAAGASVTHVIEAQATHKVAKAMLQGALLSPKLLGKGLSYRRRIMAAGAKFMTGRMVSRAHGASELTSVDIAPIGPDGRPRADGIERLDADTLVVGYGLMPGSEFARFLECEMMFDRTLGGWVPRRSELLETSLADVYAIGDGAGIGGVEVALAEGEIAASAILGKPAELSAYRRLNRFRGILSRAYQTDVPLTAADPHTIICRCEELTLSQLQEAARLGPTSLPRVKAATRLGMGRCQGRNCLASAAALTDGIPAPAPFPRTRPPTRPVRLDDLIKDDAIGPAREPDESVASSVH
jgi:NADPH-dependent 2,4-dienoyl-CoA reductase/sulfur reductase-like enzyme